MNTHLHSKGSLKTCLSASPMVRLTALLAVTLLMVGCGSGGSGSSSPPPPTVSVTVSPSTATVQVGKTQQFTATVSGTSNTAVTWSVNSVAGGNSTVGTVSSSGLYTAPNAVPSPNSVTVTATSQADTTKSASASVTIQSPSVSVAVSPATAMLSVNQTQQFTATVSGATNTAVTWSVNAVTGGNSTLGTISSSGLYRAPGTVPNPSTVTVTATSQADTTASASASVTIAGQVTVTAGQTTSGINFSLTSLTPTLQFIALGTCSGTQCTGGSTGARLTQGSTATLFLVGNGFASGTAYSVSGPLSDVVLGPPTYTQTTSNPVLDAATMSATVSPTATPGPRNVMVTNGNGELTVFVGGLLICPASGCTQ